MNGPRVFARAICCIGGLYYASFGALLFFWPHTFWNRIAPFGPFNEHYARDIGSFLLPLGICLLVAVSDPFRFRGIIALAATGSALHALSHLIDGIGSRQTAISDAALVAIAVLLATVSLLRSRGVEG